MDPDATLAEMLEEARADQSEFHEGIHRLAELVLALDEWLRKGGFLPTDWHSATAAKGDRLFPPDPPVGNV